MAAIGVAYLLFENRLLKKSKLASDSTAPADNSLSRSLIGIQVWNSIEASIILTASDRLYSFGRARDKIQCNVITSQGRSSARKPSHWMGGPCSSIAHAICSPLGT